MHINNRGMSGNIAVLFRMMNRLDSRCNHRNVKFVHVVWQSFKVAYAYSTN